MAVSGCLGGRAPEPPSKHRTGGERPPARLNSTVPVLVPPLPSHAAFASHLASQGLSFPVSTMGTSAPASWGYHEDSVIFQTLTRHCPRRRPHARENPCSSRADRLKGMGRGSPGPAMKSRVCPGGEASREGRRGETGEQGLFQWETFGLRLYSETVTLIADTSTSISCVPGTFLSALHTLSQLILRGTLRSTSVISIFTEKEIRTERA